MTSDGPNAAKIPSDTEIIAAVSDELPVGVWVARAPQGEFVYANRMFREIMGMEARSDVAAGEYAQPYGIHGRDGALYRENRMPFVRALEARTTVVVDDIVIHRADGRRVYIRASAKPIFSTDGEAITHVVIAFIDITREVENERARVEMETRLHRAQRAESIGMLAGGIAHDFNNMLAVVKLLASNLRRTERDPLRVEDLRRIDDVTDSAAKLTRSLLGFAGRGKNRVERVSLNRLAEAMVEIFGHAIDRRIEVTVNPGATPGEIVGDVSQMEQLLMNLVVNARDAIPEHGRIEIRTRQVAAVDSPSLDTSRMRPGPHVVLEVADTGSGIDPAIRDRIFEPYFTTKTTGSRPGTGLGLATVLGIVEAHGGAVEAIENRPRGTILRVYLPAAPDVERGPEPTVERASADGRRGQILLIEDDATVRDAARRVIERVGHRVLTACDGVEGIEIFRLRYREIDAVVLDMIMPGMNGRATYRAMREVDPSVPVLLTTGYALNEEAQSIIDLGVRELLEKPYDADGLIAALGRILRPQST